MILSDRDIQSVDKESMGEKVAAFPEHLAEGWEIGGQGSLEIQLGDVRNIVFGGMGGSAIAGDMIAGLFSSRLQVPYVVNRDYSLPGFTDKNTLFIASSYSGNTEETLSALSEAESRGCSVLCVTSGGKVKETGERCGYPVFHLPGGYPPRAALGYSLGTLIRIFTRLGLRAITEAQFQSAVEKTRSWGKMWQEINRDDNPAINLAKALEGKLPMINISDGRLYSVGLRWKTQINENSKSHAAFLPFPEMNHNEIMGWQMHPSTKPFLKQCAMVILRDPEDHPRIQKRMDITKELVRAEGLTVEDVVSEGDDFLSRFFYLIHLGDFVSYYLAVLYGVDPTEIKNIDHLKEGLSKI